MNCKLLYENTEIGKWFIELIDVIWLAIKIERRIQKSLEKIISNILWIKAQKERSNKSDFLSFIDWNEKKILAKSKNNLFIW